MKVNSVFRVIRLCLLPLLFNSAGFLLSAEAQEVKIPEDVYKTDLIAYPKQWAFQLGKAGIILVSDRDLLDLTDPDKKIDLSTSFTKQVESLRDICERAQKSDCKTLIVAYDQFFRQYRPGQTTPRALTPDMDEYIEKIAVVSKFAEQYGLRLELSLLSPLEVGPAYARKTGESGKWLHYRKGMRDPLSGAYSVQLWRQEKWANNKGAILLQDAGVRVFAFKEQRVADSPYLAVDPKSIVEITPTAQVERFEGAAEDRGDYRAELIRVYGKGMENIGALNRVLLVQQYKSPEMDYFSPNAYPYLQDLVDRYVNAGVKLNALYSDEMHIQQDWGYFNHHDNGELALRYVSDGLAKKFADTYGAEYADFAKYMVYFCEGQEDYRNDLQAKLPLKHVFGSSPDEIRKTALFRSNYYRFLQDGVVDLFAKAKKHAESRYGYLLHSRAHATWAESPTIDYWNGGQGAHYSSNYEYTSDYLWSNTVHQAASACFDYFKWGDFLTGNGNDHCECGWLDRNYTGLTLACSTGIINELPNSYGAHWGMPNEIARRRMSLVNASGCSAESVFAAVEDCQHRDVDVLTLYPIDLVGVDEHFGSWMTQYAYANYITQSKLLELGKVENGKIDLCGRKFGTLTVAFEPFPSRQLLAMITTFVNSGGKMVWCSPPPVLSREGEPILAQWQDLFGVDYKPGADEGAIAVGRKVEFQGVLAGIEPQIILTHLLVDRIYPVTARESIQPIASVQGRIVGTYKKTDNGGSLTFLGFRPRDDQAQSLGYDVRTWFDILNALGAYPSSGKFANVNDNTEVISRTSDYFACHFPNGALTLAKHLKTLVEDWNGGFARNEEQDKKYRENNPLPTETIQVKDLKIGGHELTYAGEQVVAFRPDDRGGLLAFAGRNCQAITIDGKTYQFADKPLSQISFAPVPQERQVPGGALYTLIAWGDGEIRLPLLFLPEQVECFAEGANPGSRGALIPSSIQNGNLVVALTPASNGRWIYVVKK